MVKDLLSNNSMSTNNNNNIDIKTWIKSGDFKKHILNEKNIYITEKFINKIFKRYKFNHKVKNLKNFQRAMVIV